MASQMKNVASLRAGDVVNYYGGQFQILEDAKELQSYRPQSANITTAPGPCNGAIARAVCIGGIPVEGYFEVGTAWAFQGTYAGPFAVSYQVEA